jgi:hypothetical protein
MLEVKLKWHELHWLDCHSIYGWSHTADLLCHITSADLLKDLMPESVVRHSSRNHLSIVMSTHTPCILQKHPWNHFACRLAPVFKTKWSTTMIPGLSQFIPRFWRTQKIQDGIVTIHFQTLGVWIKLQLEIWGSHSSTEFWNITLCRLVNGN